MASKLYGFLSKDIGLIIKPFVRHKSQRRTLGKPPGVARSLEQRMADLEVSPTTVTDWTQFVRETVVDHMETYSESIGGPGTIVEIYENIFYELNFKDPSVHFKVDIGFPQKRLNRREVMASRISEIKGNKNNIEMENLSRENKLQLEVYCDYPQSLKLKMAFKRPNVFHENKKQETTEIVVVPLDKVEDDWMRTVGPLHIKAAAEHYGVFDHLYGDAYFVPNVALDVFYTSGADEVPVYRGNTLKPSQAANCPTVNFEAEPGSLWTLVMTTPDCHLESENSEYVHWLVGNIKGGKVSEGETIWDYLQPFPFRGVGYCRYIFVLYKQTGPVDYSALKKTLPCLNLSERTFSTYDFYCERQDLLTPAGLAFYQADWDSSVTSLLRSTLNMTSSPVYSYDFPEPYRPPQKWFPLKQPFNLYMDRYRDEKQIAKEFVVKKLKRTHPFKPPEPPLQFPNCIPFKKGTPSWLKLEMRKERLGWGRINDY